MKRILDELYNTLNKYIEATNSHNFDNVVKCIDKNAIYWFSNKNCSTTEDIRSFFTNTWNIIKEEKYTAENCEWIAVSDSVATCIYNYKWEGIIDGVKKNGGGRATNIFRKTDGYWLLIHEHLSPDPTNQ